MLSNSWKRDRRPLLAMVAIGGLVLVGWLLLEPLAGVSGAQTGPPVEILSRILRLLESLFGPLLGPVLSFLRELFGSGLASP